MSRHYIHNSKVFAVIPGGASANSVFSKDYTDRIYIKKAKMMIPDMPETDVMNNAKNVTYIDCYKNPYRSYNPEYPDGPHMIGATRKLKDFCRDNDMLVVNKLVVFSRWTMVWIWWSCAIIRKILQVPAHKLKTLIKRVLKR